MIAITHCALYTLRHDCNFVRGEADEPGAMAGVQKEAAEAEHRGVSLSLLLSDEKVSLGSQIFAFIKMLEDSYETTTFI